MNRPPPRQAGQGPGRLLLILTTGLATFGLCGSVRAQQPAPPPEVTTPESDVAGPAPVDSDPTAVSTPPAAEPSADRAAPVLAPAADDGSASARDILGPAGADLDPPSFSPSPLPPQVSAPQATPPPPPASSWILPDPPAAAPVSEPTAPVSVASAPAAPRPGQLLDIAYRELRSNPAGARQAFLAAARAGAPTQQVAIELGYLALAAHDPDEAKEHFETAAAGPDPTLALRAEDEARLLPRHFWGEVYGEAFGWSRSRATYPLADLVSTVRVRGLWRPVLSLDLHFYGFMQASRDVKSRGSGAAGIPEIYADNYALGGLGVLVRGLGGKVGGFAQAGPAIDLLNDGRERMTFDGRAGLFAGLASAGCAPEAGSSRLRLVPCLDGYGEAVYVSRFAHNVIGFGRFRAGASYLTTGPVAWQLLGEVRLGLDRNQDYYNNFADAGVLQRWRLLKGVPFDLVVGAHAGRFLGIAGGDPAPARLGYLDLRLIGSTYVTF